LYFNADGAEDNTFFSWDGTVFTLYPLPYDMEDPLVYKGVLYFNGEPIDDDDAPEYLYSLRTSAVPALADTGLSVSMPLGLAAAVVLAGAGVLAVVAARRGSATLR